MKKAVLLLFFALGFFSLLSQTIVIREFIISFGGNELGIGLFYFFWLFWVGIGAVLSQGILRKFLENNFLKLLVLYPVFSFFELVLFINLRGLARVSWWEFFSLEKVFLYLGLITSFISLFTGIIFTQGASWIKRKVTDASGAISCAYVFESLGSFFAGCAATILIVRLASAVSIFIFASIVFYTAALIVSIRFREKLSIILNVFFLVLSLFLLQNQGKVIEYLQTIRTKNLIPQGEFLKEAYTPYQHVILAKLSNQKIILSNGEITASIPEVVDADKIGALCMAQADEPRDILIFGYGAENLITSLLKFPLNNIVYCIEDRVYYTLIKDILPDDNRLKIIFKPARIFLKERNKFSLIIAYTPDPSNLVLNSFFTKEFYALIKNNLTEEGVFATRISSAENFLGSELRNYGSSLYYTLKEVFPKIVIVPETTNWFFAGASISTITCDPLVLEARFKGIAPSGFSFSPGSFRSIFLADRVKFISSLYADNRLFKEGNLINEDKKPLTFFLNILVLARYSNSYLVKFAKGALFAGLPIFVIPLIIFFVLRVLFIIQREPLGYRSSLFNGKLFQFSSGFLGFSFHLSLIFLFQNTFGTIFGLIGFVNGLFMLGLCIGGYLGLILQKKISTANVIIAVLVTQALLIFTAYPILTEQNLGTSFLFLSFIFFFLASGILTGTSYPLIAKIFDREGQNFSFVAARLALLDHWGGSGAGILTGLCMLPLLGVHKTFIVLFIVAIIPAVLFLLERTVHSRTLKETVSKNLSFPYIKTSYVLFAVCVSFIINSYLIDSKRNIWEERAEVVSKFLSPDCAIQENPFPAYICESRGKKRYVLDSKNFAEDIKGFSGPVRLSLTIDEEGNINEIKILEHRETPSYIKNFEDFLAQFINRRLDENFSLDTVDAVSGATITSQAIIDTVNEISLSIASELKAETQRSQITSGGKKIRIDYASIYLLIFVFLGIVLYILPYKPLLRRLYLLCVVIFSGFVFNLLFSFFHLAGLITFNLGQFKFLSHALIYIIPLFLGLLFGQVWCGWLCPFGALTEIIGSSKLSRRVSPSLDRVARYFKYIFLAFFIVVVTTKRDAYLFMQEPLSVFFLKPLEFSDKLLSIIVLFFSIFFLRFWCRYFCACGALLSLFNKIALLKKFFVKRYKNCSFGATCYSDLDCIQCNLCLKTQINADKGNAEVRR